MLGGVLTWFFIQKGLDLAALHSHRTDCGVLCCAFGRAFLLIVG